MESSLTSRQWELEQWYVQEFNCEDRLASHEWGLPFCRFSEGICILFMLFGSQSSGETLYLCLVSLRVRLWDGKKVRGVWWYKGHNWFPIRRALSTGPPRRRGLISMGFCPEGRGVFIPSYIQPNNKKR